MESLEVGVKLPKSPAVLARSGREAMIVSLAVPIILYTTGVIYVWQFEVDDSYIPLRYASNLVSGYGLVFNPGGPRIEGYTNLLLVLIETLLIRLGARELWPVKMLLVGCGVVTLVAISWYGFRRLGEARSWLWQSVPMAVTLAATSSPFILWTASGMESALFVSLVSGGAILYSLFLTGRLRRASHILAIDFLFAGSALARPEGLLFCAVTACHSFVIGAIRRGKAFSGARLAGVLSTLIFFAGYGLWKLVYFGSLLPATYLAKQTSPSLTTFAGGGRRLLGFLGINGNFFVALVVLGGLVVAGSRLSQLKKSPLFYFGTLTGVYLAYVLSLGFHVAMDDAYRFYVPLIPLMTLLVLEVALGCRSYIRRNWSAWMTSCVVALTILVPLRFHDLVSAWQADLNWGAFAYQLAGRDVAIGLRQGHIRLGLWLREHAPRDAVIVLSDAGAIPYFSGLQTIDTWSLTDPQLLALNRALASAASDVERTHIRNDMRSYVLSLDPEYIVQDRLSLLEDPEILARYRKAGTFTYQQWYMCGRQQACQYVLEPYERRDVR